MRLYFSTRCGPADSAPRAQCSDNQDTSQVFGVDADLAPGGVVEINSTVLGYPRRSLSELSGAYCVQAELFRFEVYRRGDGVNLTLARPCETYWPDADGCGPG